MEDGGNTIMKWLVKGIAVSVISAVFIYASTAYVDAKHQEAMGRIAINNMWIKNTSKEMGEMKEDLRDIHKHYFTKYRGNK